MSITLASTWEPRGELARFERYLPVLHEMYAAFVVVMPETADDAIADAMTRCGVVVVRDREWAQGRYLALTHALETGTTHIQYCDFDRLVRWVETRPAELRAALARLQTAHCLMMNRSDAAQATHPRCLFDTEAIVNSAFSRLLGQPLDFSSGTKGLSREAARFLLANTAPAHGFGTDTEWPVLLHRAGVPLETVWVDGLDWETADRYRDSAAGPELQRATAKAYDADPANWAFRVRVAQIIVDAGLAAMQRPLKMEGWTP